jgi:hypothetical protein
MCTSTKPTRIRPVRPIKILGPIDEFHSRRSRPSLDSLMGLLPLWVQYHSSFGRGSVAIALALVEERGAGGIVGGRRGAVGCGSRATAASPWHVLAARFASKTSDVVSLHNG